MFTVETLPQYRIAYVRQVGPYGPANTQTMEKLKKWAAERSLLEESAILLGIPQDNPETTLPADCRYDACIVLSEDYRIDDSISESKLPSGKYMVCKVKHTAEDLQKAWAELYPALQNGEYQMDNKPILERYTGKMLMDGFCEICVPIKPL